MDELLDGWPDGEVTEGRHLEGGSLRRSFAAEAPLFALNWDGTARFPWG